MNTSKKPIRTGAGCLFAFAVPFCLGGIGAAIAAADGMAAENPDWKQIGFLALFAVVFGGAGCGVMAFSIMGHRKLLRSEELKQRYPESPWRWRDEWCDGHVPCRSKVTVWTAWVVAISWSLVSLPVVLIVPEEVLAKENYLALLALVFPLVGLGLIVWAVRSTLHWRKFGTSHFEMADQPGALGGRLGGVIHCNTKLTPDDGFRVGLSCVRKVTKGSDDSRSTNETILWQEEHIMARELREADPQRTAIPVAFSLPANLPPSDDSEPDDRTEWRLTATAVIEGLDFNSTFEVPVFRIDESRQGAPASTDPAAAYRKLEEPHQPECSRIAVEEGIDGRTVITYPACRNPSAAFTASVFLAILIGATALQLHLGAPIIFPMLTSVMTLFLVLVVVELWLGTTRVTFDPISIQVTSGILGSGRMRTFAAEDIEKIDVKMGMRSGRNVYYDIEIVPGSGHRTAAGRHIRSKREAEWLARRMSEVVLRERSAVS